MRQTEVVVTRGHEVSHRVWKKSAVVIVWDSRTFQAWVIMKIPKFIRRYFRELGLHITQDAKGRF